MTTWKQIRLQILERDGYICQKCLKQKEFLEIHHIIPRKKGGLNLFENLVTICRKCHFDTHGKSHHTTSAIFTSKTKHKLHYLIGRFFVVIDPRLVEKLKLDERTVFEETLTESGDIVLRGRLQ